MKSNLLRPDTSASEGTNARLAARGWEGFKGFKKSASKHHFLGLKQRIKESTVPLSFFPLFLAWQLGAWSSLEPSNFPTPPSPTLSVTRLGFPILSRIFSHFPTVHALFILVLGVLALLHLEKGSTYSTALTALSNACCMRCTSGGLYPFFPRRRRKGSTS